MTSTKLICLKHKHTIAIFHGQKKTEVSSSKAVDFVNGSTDKKGNLYCLIEGVKHPVMTSPMNYKAVEFKEKP